MAQACDVNYTNIFKYASDMDASVFELNLISECNALFKTSKAVGNLPFNDYHWLDLIKGDTEHDKVENFLKDAKLMFDKSPTYIKEMINDRKLSEVFNATNIHVNVIDLKDEGLHPLGFIIKTLTDEKFLNDALGKSMFDSPQLTSLTYNAQQKEAIESCSNWINNCIDGNLNKDYFLLEGKAGTGKTTVIQEALYRFMKDRGGKVIPRVTVAAISHQATGVIERSMGAIKNVMGSKLSFHSYAQLTGQIQMEDPITGKISMEPKQKFKPSDKYPIEEADIIIVDECSMISQKEIDEINRLKQGKALVVFMGDSGQIEPIESSDISPIFSNAKHKSTLVQRMRQSESANGEQNPILAESDKYWNTENGLQPRANEVNNKGGIITTNQFDIDSIADIFSDATKNNMLYRAIVICAHNQYRKELGGLIHNSVVNKLGAKVNEFTGLFDGENIMSYVNTSQLTNGQIVKVLEQGEIQKADKYEYCILKIQDQNGKIDYIKYSPNIEKIRRNESPYKKMPKEEASKHWSAYKEWLDSVSDIVGDESIFYAYTVTDHKVQGSTYDVAIVDSEDIRHFANRSDNSNRTFSRMMYTALTRASKLAIVKNNSYNAKMDNYKAVFDKINDSYKTPTNEELLKKYDQKNTVILDEDFTRKVVEESENEVFLFGDNVEDANGTYIPKTTQAQIRFAKNKNGESVAIGIPTKKNRRKGKDSYWNEESDEDFAYFKAFVDLAIRKAINSGKRIVLPKNGIGTGKAKLNPDGRFMKYLQSQLDALSGSTPTVLQTLNGKKSPLGPGEIKTAKEVFGNRKAKVIQASEHSDPVFHINKIIPLLEEENNKKEEDRTFKMVQYMTKHDGLALRKLLTCAPNIKKTVHFSVTTLGGTQYEPGVMKWNDMMDKIEAFVKEGILRPQDVTIRIDPIIPGVTNKEEVIKLINRAKSIGLKYFKISILDSYGNKKEDAFVVENMEKLGYDWSKYYDIINTNDGKKVSFNARKEVFDEWYKFFEEIAEKSEKDGQPIRYATCGEAPMKNNGEKYKYISFDEGCLTAKIVNAALGKNVATDEKGGQRPNCPCFAGKTDILKFGDGCASSCIYCYAGHGSDSAMEYYNEDGSLKNNYWTQTSYQPLNVHYTKGDNKLLSNFAERPVTYGGVTFKTPEGAFHAEKLRYANMSDKEKDEIFSRLLDADGEKARYIGRNDIKNLDTKQWDAVSKDVMEKVMLDSFKQNPMAANLLMSTNGRPITHINKNGQVEDKRFAPILTSIREKLMQDKAFKQKNIKTIFENIDIHSGGAIGADRLWGDMLKEYGANIHHYMIGDALADEEQVTDEEDIKVGYLKAEMANDALGYNNFAEKSKYTKQLLARDWIQVKNSDRILAISKGFRKGSVKGGTGYAVQMAITENLSGNKQRDIFVFDLNEARWFKWDNSTGTPKWIESDVPTLSQNTACIGTRDFDLSIIRNKRIDADKRALAKQWYPKAKSAIEDVIYKSIGQILDEKQFIPVQMTFEYRGRQRDDVMSKTTFDAILNGERTSTTRYVGDKGEEFWENAKVGQVVQFVSGDGRTLYAVIDNIMPLTNVTRETWSKTEGWSTEYYDKEVAPKVDKGTYIKYSLIGSVNVGDIKKQRKDYKEYVESRGNLLSTNKNIVTKITNLINNEFSVNNPSVAFDIMSNGTASITNQEMVEGFNDIKNGDTVRAFTDNVMVVGTVYSVSTTSNEGNKTISFQLNDIKQYPYDKESINEYSKFNSYGTPNTSFVYGEQEKGAKELLSTKEYHQRVTYLERRMRGYFIKMLKALKEANPDKRMTYGSIFKIMTIDQIKEKLLSDIINKDIQVSKLVEVYKKYNLFNSEEEYVDYAEQIKTRKEAVHKFMKEHFEEFFIDALTLWAREHNMNLSTSVTKDKKQINVADKNDDSNDNDTSSVENADTESEEIVEDNEFNYKLNWQLEYSHVMENATIEFREFLSTIPKREPNGNVMLNDFGEPEFIDALQLFEDLKFVLSKDCFTLSDMMNALEQYCAIHTAYKTLLTKLQGPAKRFKTDLFKLFNMEVVNYSHVYTEIDDNDGMLTIKKGAEVAKKSNNKAYVTEIKQNITKRANLLGKNKKSISSGENVQATVNSAINFISNNVPGTPWKGVDYSLMENYSEDLRNEETAIGECFKNLYNYIRSIGYNITEEALYNACTTKAESSNPFPITDVAMALYDVIWQIRSNSFNLDDFVKDPNSTKHLNKLTKICPKDVDDDIRQGTIFMLGKQFPKYKFLSGFGLFLKHIQDSNDTRRAEYVENEYKQYDWFYHKGNEQALYDLINSQDMSTFPEDQQEVLNDLLSELSKAINNQKFSAENIEYSIKESLSTETKQRLSNGDELTLLYDMSHWRNPVAALILNNKEIAGNLVRDRVIAYNKKGYFSWNDSNVALLSLEKFFSMGYKTANNVYAPILMPNYSDAGVCEFITMPLIEEDSVWDVIDSLIEQEKSRISMMSERRKWRTAVYSAYNKVIDEVKSGNQININNLEKEEQECVKDFRDYYIKHGVMKNYTDCYYYSYPIQNLEDVDKISFDDDGHIEYKVKKVGCGTSFQFFSFLNGVPENQYEQRLYEVFSSEACSIGKIVVDNNYKIGYKDGVQLVEELFDEDITALEENGENEGIDYFTVETADGTRYFKPTNELMNFVRQNQILNITITQLLVTDLAQYKDAIDFQKRFKQVYAGVERPNVEKDDEINPYAREEMTTIDITDHKVDCSGILADLLSRANVATFTPHQQEDIKKQIISNYSDVNSSDGQSYRSLSSMRSILSMFGNLLTDEYKFEKTIIEKLLSGKKLSNKEYDAAFNSTKPFCWLFREVLDRISNSKMKIGYQIKNSEFIMFYLYQQTRNSNMMDDSVMYALNKFMEDNGIDTINFDSAIKVGGQASINIDSLTSELPINVINDYNFDTDQEYYYAIKQELKRYDKDIELSDDDEEVKKLYNSILQREKQKKADDLIKKLYRITNITPKEEYYSQDDARVKEESYEDAHERVKHSCHKEVVKIFKYENYGIISKEHEHYLDRKQKLGTQLVRLLMADNQGTYKIPGINNPIDGKNVYKLISGLLGAKALIHKEKLVELFSDDAKLAEKILESMRSNSKYSKSTMETVLSTDKDGRLNKLGDIVIKNQVESLLNSYVRREINEVKLDGGTCTMVTAAYSNNLHIKYGIDENGDIYIKYWEVVAPLPFKKLLSRYMNGDNFLDINAFKNDKAIDDLTKEKILEVLGCRIPTESKHSIQHLKIVNFSVPQNGSCVYLPFEITVTAGADFDIDHVYMWRYSFDWVDVEEDYTDANGNKQVRKNRVPKFVDYKDERGSMINVADMDENQINNALLDVFRAVLESPNSFNQELTPNGYDSTKKAAYVGSILFKGNFMRDIPIKERFEVLKSMSNDDLSKELAKSTNRCGLINQLAFFKQNAFGKGLIGQMAVNDVFLALLQNINVGVNDKYVVKINGYSNNHFQKIKNDNGQLMSTLIMEFLGSAPDSAKDPVLLYLGANSLTIHAITAAAMLGYDIQDISLLFNNPRMTRFLNRYFGNSNFITKERLAEAINKDMLRINPQTVINKKTGEQEPVKLYNGNLIKVGDFNTISLTRTPELTLDNLLGIESEPNAVAEEKILATFYNLFCIGQDLFELSMSTRADSTGGAVGASIADGIAKGLKIKAIKMKAASKDIPYSLTNVSSLFKSYSIPMNFNLKNKELRRTIVKDLSNMPLGHIQGQISFGIEDLANYYSGRFIEYSPTMLRIFHIMSMMNPQLSLDEKTIKLIANEYIKYKLSELPFFGNQEYEDSSIATIEDKMNYVVNNTWRDINTLKQLYPEFSNNILLKNLELNNKNIIILPDAGDLKDTEKQKISDAWDELIHSNIELAKGIGYNLIRYSFYRNVMKFAPDGFGHLCPNVRQNIPGYDAKLQELYNIDENPLMFISELINNCYEQLPQTYSITSGQEGMINNGHYTVMYNNNATTFELKPNKKAPDYDEQTNINDDINGDSNKKKNKKSESEFTFYPHDANKVLYISEENVKGSGIVDKYKEAMEKIRETLAGVKDNKENNSSERKLFEDYVKGVTDPICGF